MSTVKRTKPKLWERVKKEITASNKGGRKGQWSARKAQLAVLEYKKRGGGYYSRKSVNNSLVKWTRQNWGRKYTGGRYLPEAARKALTQKEYDRTSRIKKRGTNQGKQYVPQPKDIAKKTRKYRL